MGALIDFGLVSRCVHQEDRVVILLQHVYILHIVLSEWSVYDSSLAKGFEVFRCTVFCFEIVIL